MAYNGSIELISGITQKNGGNYSLVNASAVYVDDSTRLDQKLSQLTTKINTFVPYTVTVVDELPQGAGQDRTFYLVKRPSGKYDKWWYVTNELGQKVWDSFGGSSTAVVTNLPEAPDEDTDYILVSNGEYKYYKWINNEWALIAGSSSEVIDLEDNNISLNIIGHDVPTSEIYNPFDYIDKYYLKDDSMSLYYCDGSDWTLLSECLVANPSDSKDYYILNESDIWCHYRYIDGVFELIGGGGGYSKSEIDSIITGINTKLDKNISDTGILDSNVSLLNLRFGSLQQTIEGMDTEGYKYYATYEKEQDSDDFLYSLYEIKDGVEKVVSQFVLQGGGGGLSSSTLIVRPITKSPLIILPTDLVWLEFEFSSTDEYGSNFDGTYIWEHNGGVIGTGDCDIGLNRFNVTEYCAIGVMERFILTVTDRAKNTASRQFNVKRTDIRISSSFNDSYYLDPNQKALVKYITYGSISKTVHFQFDGIETTLITSDSDIEKDYEIQPQSHGAHLLKMWITAVVNNIDFSTIDNAVYKDIIWYDPENNNAPIIGCIYRYDYHGVVKLKLYDSLPISYTVLDPSTNFPVVKRYIDDVFVGTETLLNSTSIWNYKSDKIGTHTLKLVCKDTLVLIVVNIEKLNIDVSPITSGLEIDFNPNGLSNNSSDRVWHNDNYHMIVSNNFDWSNGGYKIDDNGDDYFLIKAGTYVEFDYELFGGGLNNNPSVRGSEIKLIFMTENILSIDAIWMTNTETTVVTNEQSDDQTETSLDLQSESVTINIGILLGVHEGWLKTNKASEKNIESEDDFVAATNTYLYMPYSDNDIIELDINIESLDKQITNSKSFIMAYEDGVPSKAYVYDQFDLLFLYNPKRFHFGSDFCDVRIYRFKVYSTSLSTNNILKNFIADSRDSVTMLDRYNRNSIYYNADTKSYSPYRSTEFVLNPEYLASKIPNVKILMLKTEHFTEDKADFVPSTLQCIHATGGSLYPGDGYYDNWLFENGYHSGQGTTSNTYGLSGRNIDFLFNCDGTHKPSNKVNSISDYISKLTLGYKTSSQYIEYCDDWKGQTGKITLTRTSVPNNFFNLKVNIASSDNVNNALLQKRYNDFLPYISPASLRDSKIKNDMEFVPAILFVKETGDNDVRKEFLDNEWHFYALGNLGDSKKTDYTRAYDPLDMNEFTIEISDNTKNNATFQTGVFINSNGEREVEEYEFIEVKDKNGNTTLAPASVLKPDVHIYPITLEEWNNPNNMRNYCLYNEDFDGDHSFESRYACCGDYRDGKLVNDTTLNGKKQVKKNENVWRAFYRWVITSSDEQFQTELDEWCVRDAVEFFYAFTHYYTMMDNRAKNTFWHFAKTGIFRKASRPVEELLHIYSELVNGEYVTTTDTEIIEGKEYYTQYAFDLWDYDNDTAIGINNNGELIFPYGREDDDYNIDGDVTSGWVFNGATSVFWCRLRDLLSNEISSIFSSVKTQCFNATNLITQFDNFQDCFPEEIWRLDIERKYIRTFTGKSIDNSIPKQDLKYLRDMMQGRKKYQRRQWIRDLDFYFGTKYLSNSIKADNITFRSYYPGSTAVVEPDYFLDITPYSDMYIIADFGNGETLKRRAKANIAEKLTFAVDKSTDTQVVIYGASRISALNDLSTCYITAPSFGNAIRLKKLILGNETPGYNNSRLTTITLGSNKLLEEFDIRNCRNFIDPLNFTECTNLKYLYAENSRTSGVFFAPFGKLEIAHLPSSITSLQMLNLNNLIDFLCSLDFLQSLILQGGNLDNISIVQNTIDTLTLLTLYDIDWVIPNTSLLNQMLNLFYSNITGTVFIAGSYRENEILQYNEAWPDLEILVDPNNIVTQNRITYRNLDKNNTILYIAYVDLGSLPPDPYADGLIEKPVLADSERYTYSFGTEQDGEYVRGSGWDTINTPVIRDRNVYAVYTSIVKTFTVSWYERPGVLLKQITGIEYGEEVVYDGAIPTRSDGEEYNRYYLFLGWNKSTGYVTQNIDVYAIWDMGELPEIGTPMWEMTPAQLYAVGLQNEQDTYFKDADYVDIILGHDFNFENVISYEIGSDVILDGIKIDNLNHIGYYFDKSSAVTTDILLLTENDNEFTMVIDFQFNPTENYETLVSCNEGNNDNGIRLYYLTNLVYLKWGGAAALPIGYIRQRDIIVLRHPKNSKTLYLYSTYNYADASFRNTLYSETTTVLAPTSPTSVINNEPLTFGAVNYKNNSKPHQYLCNATLHWCKIWKSDLGDDVCKQLASWPRELIRMHYWGKEKYMYADKSLSSDKCKASFVTNTCIGGFYGRNVKWNMALNMLLGWETCNIRNFANNKFFYALPFEWQALIKEVEITSGNYIVNDSGIEVVVNKVTNDKIYLQGYAEIVGDSANYNIERGVGNPPIISWSVVQRQGDATYYLTTKYRGIIKQLHGNTIYITGTDPIILNHLSHVDTGTIWHTTNSYQYIYIDEDIFKQYFPPEVPANSDVFMFANSDYGCHGIWVRAEWHTLRSVRRETQVQLIAYIHPNGTRQTSSTPTNNWPFAPSFSF